MVDEMAHDIAVGVVDPITLLPMVDILPEYKPCSVKQKHDSLNVTPADKGKGKAPSRSSGGLFDYYGKRA